MGDAPWLRARHAEGALNNQSGLVTQAVKSNRPGILTLLLDLGLDPDESGRVGGLDEVVPTSGEPLRECGRLGRHDLAEILLTHGANPNTNVYAASSAVDEAYARRDEAMIALLERYGGRLSPGAVVGVGVVAQAARLLEDEAAAGNVAEELLSERSRARRLKSCEWRSSESIGRAAIRIGTGNSRTHFMSAGIRIARCCLRDSA